MNKHTGPTVSLIVAVLFMLPLAAHAQAINKANYDSAKTRIEASYQADQAGCASLAGNAKDICVEQAKGSQKVALAELEYGYSAKAGDRDKVLVARAEATYAIARERCDDKAGNVKDVCLAEAKAAESKAFAEAKMGKEIVRAEKDAGIEMRAADRKVAIEKCDALAGDAKAHCLADADAKFGK